MEAHRRGGRGLVVTIVAALLAGSGVLVAPGVAPAADRSAQAAGSFTDPWFRETEVLTGLAKPTAIRFAADGRVFVAEKRGRVKAFDSLADTTPTTVIDLTSETNSYWDRGLLGMALDPSFTTTRPYLYLYYVYDAPIGGTAPIWNDACPAKPNGPGGLTDGCVVSSKLVRYTLGAGNVADPASRVELLWDWCQQFPSHSGGGLVFGPDGQLYVSGGDGAGFHTTDWGQFGGTAQDAGVLTPANPCGDPPNPAGTPNTNATTAEGGSLRSQDLRTTADPTGLDGAIIRVNPNTGAASTGNPLIGSPDLNARRIVGMGLRNPYRIAFRPGTSELYIGDVGQSTWEEIERLDVPTGGASVPNFGWPCYEGQGQSSWNTLGNAICAGLYGSPGAVTSPVYAYSHVDTNAPTGPCFAPDGSGKQSSAVTGVAFYEGGSYPSAYDGALFFTDYGRNCMAVMFPGSDGRPDPATTQVFLDGASHPVDLVTGPGGDLFYADLDGGRIVRVRYLVAPVARAKATPASGIAPLQVTLDASTSSDPDPAATLVAWRWDLDADGVFTGPGDASGKTVVHTFPNPAVYPVTLQVESSNGRRDTTTIQVDASNQPPVPRIAAPSGTLTWSVGDAIPFSGSATDPQDGTLPAASLAWDLWMVHCPADCHEHLIQEWIGVAGGTIDAPDHEYPSHLELRLTATDSGGATATTSVTLMPKTASLSVASNPTGVPIFVGEASEPTPIRETFIRNGQVAVSAPATTVIGGQAYRFVRWTDGGPRSRTMTLSGAMSIKAHYLPDAPETCSAASASSPTNSWIRDRLGDDEDADWFRFSLGSARTVQVTLGNLPVDARLELYGACSQRIAVSNAAGVQFEQIVTTLAAGTYRVRVSSPTGASSTSPYVVRFRPLPTGTALLSWKAQRYGSTVRVVGEVMNTSGATRGPITVYADLRDSKGQVVATISGRAFQTRIGNRGATSFAIRGTAPSYANVTFRFAVGAPPPVPQRLSLTLKVTPGPGGSAVESGTVKNVGWRTTTGVTVARVWYGRRGEVLDQRSAYASPRTLGVGRTGAWSITRPALPTLQASRTELRRT